MQRGLLIAAIASLVLPAVGRTGPMMSPVAEAHFNRCADRAVSANVRLTNCTIIIDSNEAPPADMAVALNNRGIAYEEKDRYLDAIRDFTEAIRQQPYYAMAFDNRGFAHFVTGRFTQAASDLARGLEINPNYTYAALWRSIALARIGKPYRPDLERRATRFGTSAWPGPIVELYIGAGTAEGVKAAMLDAPPDQRAGRDCEVGFYVGEYRLIQGAQDAAMSLLKKAASACGPDTIEYYGARSELERLSRTAAAPEAAR